MAIPFKSFQGMITIIEQKVAYCEKAGGFDMGSFIDVHVSLEVAKEKLEAALAAHEAGDEDKAVELTKEGGREAFYAFNTVEALIAAANPGPMA